MLRELRGTTLKVLVTGSSGFVGQNLVIDLVEKGFDVVALDKDPSNVKLPKVTYVSYRLGSHDPVGLEDFKSKTVGVNCILHLAAESHVDRSISGPLPFVENNIIGTLELFELARDLSHLNQIVLFSTDEVGACLEQGSFYEKGQAFKCGSVYSASKGAQELLAQAYVNTYNLPIITTRCVNIFGPNQADEKLIPTVIRKALNNEKIPVYGSGMQMRQWVSVSHVVDMLNQLAISTCIPPNSVIHITGTHEIYNIVLVHTILNLLDKPSSLIEHTRDRLGHDVRYSLGKSEETDRFGLSEYAQDRFMEDLDFTVRWYKSHYVGGNHG